MGMTMSEKILARHAKLANVEAGQLVICDLDLVMANDVTGPPSIKEFEKIGRPVFDAKKNRADSRPLPARQRYQIG